MYTPVPVYQKILFERTGLSNAAHTLEITVTGTKSSSSSNTTVYSDAFERTGTATTSWIRTEQNGSGVVYGGTGWTTLSNSSASGGSFHYARLSGNTVTFSFTGTGVRWIGQSSPYGGIANVQVDGVSAGSVNMYTAGTIYKKILFERTGLSNAAHTLRISVTGTSSPSAQSTTVYADAFDRLA
jgi:hypothetical protein